MTEQLDPRETLHRIAGDDAGLRILLRHLPPAKPTPRARPVLYIHGATFPSALSVAHRFDGFSWRDSLADAGFDVWALDFIGFGGSDRYPAMAQPADAAAPLGRAADAADQVARAVAHILGHHGMPGLSLIAHSWGSVPACRFASENVDMVDRIVLFGPIAVRDGAASPASPGWRLVSAEAQWTRFTADTPADHKPVLLRRHFDDWASRYLATDPMSGTRDPPAVAVPAGPSADIADAWSGKRPYDPAAVAAPVCIIRGAWDSLSADADARCLFDAFASPIRRDIKIAGAGHLMHLEEARHALYRETENFLLGESQPGD
jgi:pimeloyl-ACP methyl ester carboxylesterase